MLSDAIIAIAQSCKSLNSSRACEQIKSSFGAPAVNLQSRVVRFWRDMYIFGISGNFADELEWSPQFSVARTFSLWHLSSHISVRYAVSHFYVVTCCCVVLRMPIFAWLFRKIAHGIQRIHLLDFVLFVCAFHGCRTYKR